MPRLPLIISIALLIWLSSIGGARTYIVDDDGFANYKTIQEAVVAADDGDTIFVKQGTYIEEIVLNKSLTLMPLLGESGPIILKGDGKETGITISSDGCSLEGFTLQNYTGSAVSVLSSGNIIKKNVFVDSSPAILVHSSSRNSINGNLIEKCQGGVALRYNSSDNSIQENEIYGSNISVFIGEGVRNSVLNNNISDSYWGIWLDNSSNIRIDGNDVGSRNYGILLFNSSRLNVTGNKVWIENDGAISTRAIFLANTSEVELHENEVNGGAIGLGVLDSLNNRLAGNTVANSSNAIFIRDTDSQEVNGNHIKDAEYAIRLDNSSRNSIRQNTVENSTIAFDLGAGTNNNVTENRFSNILDTAVQIASSSKNDFLENQITNSTRGFILSESPANLLRGNLLQSVEWSLYVESEAREGFNNSIDESNVADMVPIVYLFDRSSGEVRDRMLAHLTLAYCSNILVQNATITRDAVFLFDSRNNTIRGSNISDCFGMRLVNSSGNEILDNRLIGNRYSGIFLFASDWNQITGNTASDNDQNGISLLSCNQNIIRDNSVNRNKATGIWLNLSNDNQIYQNNITENLLGCQLLLSTGNRVYHNNFIGNVEHSEDAGGSNSWDEGNVTGGNYWSGHVAKGNPSSDWPRPIKGGSMQDRYPFENASGWLAA